MTARVSASNLRHPMVARLPRPIRAATRDIVIRYRQRGLRSSDLLVVAYPKSGSTWLRFVLASALAAREMDFDLVREYSPGLERFHRAPSLLSDNGRLVASHERLRRVAPGQRPQVLYLVRDGRDVAISYFHHMARKGLFAGDFAAFVEPFLEGRVGPYGTWQDHVVSWRQVVRIYAESMLVVRYEDLLANPVDSLLAVSDHFDLGLAADAWRLALETNTPDAMRAKEKSSARLRAANVSGSDFVRVAKDGQWRETFDETTRARFDQVAGVALRSAGYHGEYG